MSSPNSAHTPTNRPPRPIYQQVPVSQAISLPTPGPVPFSVEFMPPRDDAAERRLNDAAATFHDLGASFVSVTYGAGGSSRSRTIRIGQELAHTPLTTLVHLTLVQHTVDELKEIIASYQECGLTNILALRGDPPGDPTGEWVSTPGGLEHAIDLIKLIQECDTQRQFEIGIASFPDKHYRATDLDSDTAYTIAKLRAGASYSITQMFFDVEYYLRLRDRLAAADPVHGAKPVIPGLMPITSLKSLRRQRELAGCRVPADLEERLEKATATGDPSDPRIRQEIRKIGIAHTTAMAERLISEGAPDLHFMTLNFARATQEVLHNLGMAPAWGTDHGHDAVR